MFDKNLEEEEYTKPETQSVKSQRQRKTRLHKDSEFLHLKKKIEVFVSYLLFLYANRKALYILISIQ